MNKSIWMVAGTLAIVALAGILREDSHTDGGTAFDGDHSGVVSTGPSLLPQPGRPESQAASAPDTDREGVTTGPGPTSIEPDLPDPVPPAGVTNTGPPPVRFSSLPAGTTGQVVANPHFGSGETRPAPTTPTQQPQTRNAIERIEQELLDGPPLADAASAQPAASGSPGKPVSILAAARGQSAAAWTSAPASLPAKPASSIPAALNHFRYGNTLAGRGATAAAREEFLAALMAVADARDASEGSVRYRRLLDEGWTHVRELKDFFSDGGASLPASATGDVIRAHASQLVPADRFDTVTRTEAITLYRNAAANKLAAACGGDPAAISSLAAIGKLHALRLQMHDRPDQYDLCVAVLLNQVALACSPGHPRFTNELGVLLATNGDLDQSRDLFQASLRKLPTVEAWMNLARVHDLRREPELAALARNEAARLASQSGGATDAAVRWISPEEFGAQGDTDAAHAPAGRAALGTTAPERNPGPGTGRHLPGLFRR